MNLRALDEPSEVDGYYQQWLRTRPEGVGCNLAEYRVLYAVARATNPLRILEIGPGCGASTMAFLLGAPDIDITQVTVHREQCNEVVPQRFHDQLHTFVETSDAFFARPRTGLYDLIFIDGDHTNEVVTRDIRNALERLALAGIVLLHDTLPTCIGDIGAIARRVVAASERSLVYTELLTGGHGLGVIS